MTATDLEDIDTLLSQTLVGGTGRHRRASMTWRRTGPESWDVYRPGQCPCGAPRWAGLSLNGAADVLIARLEALEAVASGGMCVN